MWQKLKRWNRVSTEWLNEAFCLIHQTMTADDFISFIYTHYLNPRILIKQFEKRGGTITSESRHLIDPLLIKAGISPKQVTLMMHTNTSEQAFAEAPVMIGYNPLVKLNDNQLRSLFAHEVAHFLNGDLRTMKIAMLVYAFLVPYLLKKYDSAMQQLFVAVKNKFAPEQESRLHQAISWIAWYHNNVANSHHVSSMIQTYLLQKLRVFMEKRADITAALRYPEYNVAQHFSTVVNTFQDDPFHPPVAERIAYLTKIAQKQALTNPVPIY